MLSSYFPVFLMILCAVFLTILLAVMSRLVGPFRPANKKYIPYESGMDPVGTARDRYSVKFYLTAMLFIIFDIEIVFMYPWAVQFRQLGTFALVEMILFIVILFVGYIYVYRKGALKWE